MNNGEVVVKERVEIHMQKVMDDTIILYSLKILIYLILNKHLSTTEVLQVNVIAAFCWMVQDGSSIYPTH